MLLQIDSISESASSFMGDTVAMAIGGAFLLVFAFIWCRIFGKAGYHGAMGLLMFIPVVNLVMILVLAFKKWPIEDELKSLRKTHKAFRDAEKRNMARAA